MSFWDYAETFRDRGGSVVVVVSHMHSELDRFDAMLNLVDGQVRPGLDSMRRLRLVGYRPRHLLGARLCVLLVILAASTAVFLTVLVPVVPLQSVAWAVCSLGVVGLIGVTLGTCVGPVVPRKFQALMILVALAGIQMALGRGGSDAGRYLPYWPGVRHGDPQDQSAGVEPADPGMGPVTDAGTLTPRRTGRRRPRRARGQRSR